MPPIDVIADGLPWADYRAAHDAREHLVRTLAERLTATLHTVRTAMTRALGDGPYAFTPAATGQRSLRNLAVSYLSRVVPAVVSEHLAAATNMTDTQTALALLAHAEGPARDAAFAAFYAQWQNEALVVDKWFMLQAQSTRPSALADVEALLRHPAFSIENPNRVRAVLGTFASGNPLHFHAASGRGFALLAEQVRSIDAFNPQIAARMLTPLTRWRRQDPPRQALMKDALKHVLAREGVSRDVMEIATKALSDA